MKTPPLGKAGALAALRVVLAHLVDHGKIELGTIQSRMLIEAVRNLEESR
jgi:hypothetical protein